ncbi:alkane hydroxylase MAH1 [Beta vulgaris subsp. vulgaris]|uniref:alkane hydroxylase MAH1 n=1 Tax=Beta vulgaris subsp. vulgaris TaxID=3555 RepID=UPI002036C2C3|nr:alkane hydroxylase MAH1 [Beta vulgaris subsp. vulgaris]
MGYFDISILLFPLVIFCYFFHDKNGLPTNWPFFGMIPALLKNIHRIHTYFIEVMEKSHMTFVFEGPWFTNMHILATVDPANIHHVMSKNFGNYPKGSKFNEIFDVLGDGIFNTDSTVWQYHRKMAQSFLSNPKFHQFLIKKTWDKVENGLIPILDHVSKHAIEIDLQDLFARFTFDTICTIVMDHDPISLSIDFPSVPAIKALDDTEEAIFYRHVVPTCVWKFLRWLDVGEENKHRKAWQILDTFIYKYIAMKREELSNGRTPKNKEDTELSTDLLTLYIEQEQNQKVLVDSQGDKFLRDTILNFFIAGRDTTSATLSWFFYLLSTNPQVNSKIKKELDNINVLMNNEKYFREVNSKLVYLHAALCEALRLYPPVVFQAKSPIESDMLPSGHHVDRNSQIIFNLYAMGRMKSLWGEDCYEFKPERWISEQGKIRHEPSYKFLAFNAGPRTCLGKDMAFTQMKLVAATIIQNYVIEAVEEHHVVPSISIILHMKYGFKVRVLRCQ